MIVSACVHDDGCYFPSQRDRASARRASDPIRAEVEHPFRVIKRQFGVSKVRATVGSAKNTEAGRCYERFALQANALGIRTAFVNQPVEVASMRPRFASLLGASGKLPDLVVRCGHGPAMPSSLPRDVDSVLA